MIYLKNGNKPACATVISRVGSGAPKSPSSHDTTADPPLCHFERSEAESRNLTPQWHKPLCCRRSLDSVSIELNAFISIPTCTSARDDNGGRQPYRHIQESRKRHRANSLHLHFERRHKISLLNDISHRRRRMYYTWNICIMCTY